MVKCKTYPIGYWTHKHNEHSNNMNGVRTSDNGNQIERDVSWIQEYSSQTQWHSNDTVKHDRSLSEGGK